MPMEYFNITHSYQLPDEEFVVQLFPIDDQEIEYLQQLNAKYRHLRPDDEVLMMKVKSKGRDKEIVMKPFEVAGAIDKSIQELIEHEMYEQCSVLKKIKDTFLEKHINDFK
jgi:hypothetical protein